MYKNINFKMPLNFTQKLIRKLQAYIKQCRENNKWIYGSNESRKTEKNIASLKTNRVIISYSNESLNNKSKIINKK